MGCVMNHSTRPDISGFPFLIVSFNILWGLVLKLKWFTHPQIQMELGFTHLNG
jgi:hypothetical protein